MKRTHRQAHFMIWIVLPVLLIAILWLGFSIHGSMDIDPAPVRVEGPQ